MLRLFSRILLLAALLVPINAMAAPAAESGAFNPTVFALVSIVVVLVAANALLANVLMQLASALHEKSRKERGIIKSVLLAAVLLLPAISAMAQDNVTADAAPVASLFIGGIPSSEFYFLTGTAAFLFVMMLSLILLIRMLTRELRGIPAKAHIPSRIFKRNFLDIFNKSVALEKEETIVLDHDYDGIRELDNDLPPWWKWGFVLTVIVSFIYMGYYHVWGGPHQIDEYNTAVAQAEEEKAAYLASAGEQIDETNVTMVLDAGALGDAKVLFANTCAACHRADAGGAVGPNLTDDFWLHGGALADVFKSIKYGWKDKGMPEWKHNMSAKQIAGLASYVKSLKGTHPTGPKAPQGELFVEGGDKAIDSLSNKTEPSLTPTGTTENKNNTVGPFKNKADGKGEGTPAGKVKE